MKGLSADQDVRYSDKIVKGLKTTNFPSILSHKPNIKKINLEVLRPWVSEHITQILGFEDDICIDFIFTLLEQNEDPKQIFMKIQGFLEEGTFKFMKSLWELLISAEDSVHGIPKEFVEELTKAITQARQRDEIISSSLKKIDYTENLNQSIDHDNVHPSRMGQVDKDDLIKQERFRREFMGERRRSRSRSRSIERSRRSYSRDRPVRRRDEYDRVSSHRDRSRSRRRDYDKYSSSRSPERNRRDSRERRRSSPSNRFRRDERRGRDSREYNDSPRKIHRRDRDKSPLEVSHRQSNARSNRLHERPKSASIDIHIGSPKEDLYGRSNQESPKNASIFDKQRDDDSPVLNMRDRDIERRSSISLVNRRSEGTEIRRSKDQPISPPRGSRRTQSRYESISPKRDEGRSAELELKEKILLKKLKSSRGNSPTKDNTRKNQEEQHEVSGFIQSLSTKKYKN